MMRARRPAVYLLASCIQFIGSCSNSNIRIVQPGVSVECEVKEDPVCVVEHGYTRNSGPIYERETFEARFDSGFDSTRVSLYLNTTKVFERHLSTRPQSSGSTYSWIEFYREGLFVVHQFDWHAREKMPEEWLRLRQPVDSIGICIDGCILFTPVDSRYKTLFISRDRSTGAIRLWHDHEFIEGF